MSITYSLLLIYFPFLNRCQLITRCDLFIERKVVVSVFVGRGVDAGVRLPTFLFVSLYDGRPEDFWH